MSLTHALRQERDDDHGASAIGQVVFGGGGRSLVGVDSFCCTGRGEAMVLTAPDDDDGVGKSSSFQFQFQFQFQKFLSTTVPRDSHDVILPMCFGHFLQFLSLYVLTKIIYLNLNKKR